MAGTQPIFGVQAEVTIEACNRGVSMDIVPELVKFLEMEIGPDQISGEELQADSDLLEQGIIDSMVLLRLVSFIEATYGVKVADEDIHKDNFRDLSSIERMIQRKRA